MKIRTMPGNLQVLRLNESNLVEAQLLFKLLQEVFGGDKVALSDSYVTGLLSKPDFIMFAATYQEQVAGGLTACLLPVYNSELPAVYICDIAVDPEFHRQGIGRRLLAAVSIFCAENGIPEMFVQSSDSEDNADALDFYRSGSTREERVVQFTFSGLNSQNEV